MWQNSKQKAARIRAAKFILRICEFAIDKCGIMCYYMGVNKKHNYGGLNMYKKKLEDFKFALFNNCYVNYKCYTRAKCHINREEYRLKFCSLYTVIEELELEEEYQEFKKYHQAAR